MTSARATCALIAGVLVALASACGTGEGGQGQQTEAVAGEEVPVVEAPVTPEATTAAESQATPEPQDSPGEVTFPTPDGITLAGTLYGLGDTAIILSHMFATDQTSWQPFAEVLAENGYLAMTYDFRGYGESGGSKDIPAIIQDVQAAYDFVLQQGATRVVLIGADMGGMASIKVAASPDTELAGLAVLSSPREFQGLMVTDADLSALTVPSLWLSARTDLITPQLEEMHDVAAGPDKTLWIFEGSGAHGTFIFDAPLDAEDLERRILEFLNSAVPLS